MICVAPSSAHWREFLPKHNDDQVESDFHLAWRESNDYCLGPPFENRHHDWMNFRTATLREARKRGLSLANAERVIGR